MNSPLLLKSKNNGFTCTGFDRIHFEYGGQNRQVKDEVDLVIFAHALPTN
jgi:hypothetical protein